MSIWADPIFVAAENQYRREVLSAGFSTPWHHTSRAAGLRSAIAGALPHRHSRHSTPRVA